MHFQSQHNTTPGTANVVNGQAVIVQPKATAKPAAKAKGDKRKTLAMCVLDSGEEVPISEILGEEIAEDEPRAVEIED